MAKTGTYTYISDRIEGFIETRDDYYRKGRSWSAMVLGKAQHNARRFRKGKGSPGQPRAPHTYKTGIHAGRTEHKLSKQGSGGMFFKAYRNENREYGGTGFKFPIHGIFRAWGVGNGQPRVPGKRVYHGRNHVQRKTSDWLDGPIDKNASKLADIAAAYYGDKVIVNTFGTKIVKI